MFSRDSSFPLRFLVDFQARKDFYFYQNLKTVKNKKDNFFSSMKKVEEGKPWKTLSQSACLV